MSRTLILALGLIGLAASAHAQTSGSRAHRWWEDIRILASDHMQGRLTGTVGYDRAAAFVIERFQGINLIPQGDSHTFLQEVPFETQSIDQQASRAELTSARGATTRLQVGEDMLISAGGGPRALKYEAPLVFAGYGLHLPQLGYDDFKGLDVRGRIVVVISGGPANLPGPAKAAARSERLKFLGQAGAAGLITLTTPQQVEIPWPRLKLLASQTGMYLADAKLRDTPDGLFSATVNPQKAALLFAGSDQSFDTLARLADASAPVPTFPLPQHLRVSVAATRGRIQSPNLVAKLEGADPTLKREYVVVSAHLDHLGVGRPIHGDPIYHGAMDDGSGVASVLDIARHLSLGPRPKRSILFVLFTGEEKGLLGSHYFAERPTVPRDAIVADLNMDMPLPLWPLHSVIAQGDKESTLGAVAAKVAQEQTLVLLADPVPDRNSFVRTDQFSFVRAGIPALAFKFGFPRGSREFEIEHAWRANRYHSPLDNITQPGVLPAEAVKLDDFIADIAVRAADDPARPAWLPTSIFRAGS